MPKLARNYYYPEYSNTYSTCSVVHINYDFSKNNNDISRVRPRVHKNKRKLDTLRFVFSCFILLFMAFVVLPYSFAGISKSLFNPNPYKSIKVDFEDFAFPTTKYLSNALFMNHRSFRSALPSKKAQMMMLKENVNMPALRSELVSLMELYPNVKPAVYVWDYDSQNYVDINASKIYSAASIIKIPVLIDLFKSIEYGQLSLDDKIPLTEYYRTEGSGHLQFKASNSLWSIDKLARVMITDSDNSATNMIMSKIGSMTDVNQAIRDWGINNTEVQTWLPDLNGNNHTTARDLATMLYNIDSNDKFLSEESRTKILDYMGHVHNNRLIHAGLGAGSVFYHKTGDIGKMLGDAGIVIAPNGTKYIVVILVNRNHNDIAGKDFIVHASEIIYKYMVR